MNPLQVIQKPGQLGRKPAQIGYTLDDRGLSF
jgi:hypothetical protein